MDSHSNRPSPSSPLEELLTADIANMSRDQLRELVEKLQRLTTAAGLTAALKVSQPDEPDLDPLRRLMEG
jgi:hypothetical protein